jgi:hypothetical protein
MMQQKLAGHIHVSSHTCMVALFSEVQNEEDGAVVVIVVVVVFVGGVGGGGGTKENCLKNGKCEEKSVAEICLDISCSFSCQRICICITVIHFRQHAKISEKSKKYSV